jgi:hypothetical protein
VDLLTPRRARRCIPHGTLHALASGLVLLVAAFGAAAAAAQDRSVEFAVKATYLYKFAPFVQWPAGSFASPTDPLVLCVVGDDPVGTLVAEAARDQSVDQHPIHVVHLAALEPNSRCHILYIAAVLTEARTRALDAVRGRAVLTVTDTAPAGRVRGIINFVIVEGRVRFEIDLVAAAENHLVISSKLLSLAVSIRQQP